MPSKNKKSKKHRSTGYGQQRPLSNRDVDRAVERITAQKYKPIMWGQENPAEVDISVPTGGLCRVRTIGMEGLIRDGILPQVDSLSALVSEKYLSPMGEIDVNALSSDNAEVMSVLDVVDRVVIQVVVEPQVFPIPVAPTDEEGDPILGDDGEPLPAPDRDPNGIVYVDTIPVEDKMYIFQYVTGGIRDLERFRELSEEVLGGVESIEEFASPSE